MPVYYDDSLYETNQVLYEADAFGASFGTAVGAATAEAFQRAPVVGYLSQWDKLRRAANRTGGTTGIDDLSPVEQVEQDYDVGDDEFSVRMQAAEAIESGDDWLGPGAWEEVVKERGFSPSQFSAGSRGVNRHALEIMLEAHETKRRADIAMSSAGGFAGFTAGLAGEAIVSIVDPVNLAANFVPVVSGAKYAAWLGKAGSSLGRAGVRAGVGAAEGVVGATLAEIPAYLANKQNQLNYTPEEFLTNIFVGAMFGGALHMGGGLISDRVKGYSSADNLLAAEREQLAHVASAQGLNNRVIDIDPVLETHWDAYAQREPHASIYGSHVLAEVIDDGYKVKLVTPAGLPIEVPESIRVVLEASADEAEFAANAKKSVARIERGISGRNKEIMADLLGEGQSLSAGEYLRSKKLATQGGTVKDVDAAYRSLVKEGYIADVNEGIGLVLKTDKERVVADVIADDAEAPVLRRDYTRKVQELKAVADALDSGRIHNTPVVRKSSSVQMKALADRSTGVKSDIRYDEPLMQKAAEVKAEAVKIDHAAFIEEEMMKADKLMESLSQDGADMLAIRRTLDKLESDMRLEADAEVAAIRCAVMTGVTGG